MAAVLAIDSIYPFQEKLLAKDIPNIRNMGLSGMSRRFMAIDGRYGCLNLFMERSLVLVTLKVTSQESPHSVMVRRSYSRSAAFKFGPLGFILGSSALTVKRLVESGIIRIHR